MSVAGLCEDWRGVAKPVVGMIHLPALPGSSGFGGGLDGIRRLVLSEARSLEAGGVHALMIENFGDVPFHKGRVGAETVAAMSVMASAVRQATRLPLGINVLRNDGLSAMAIAQAVGAQFIRVNVLTGAMLTDQGMIEGIAADLLRYRASLGAEHIKVLADVQVKHAAPMVSRPIEEEVDELIHRGLADGLIVSGWGTGTPTDPAAVALVKSVAGDVPVFVGSGTTAETVAALAEHADGFIVGTHFKGDGEVANPVDPGRVEALVAQLI